MKALLVAIVIASAALVAAPASAHVVQAMSSFSIVDVDVEDRPQLEQALKTAVNKVLQDTIAFTPSFVALTDAQVIGQRLYFRVLIADEEGERTLSELNERESEKADPERLAPERPARVRTSI